MFDCYSLYAYCLSKHYRFVSLSGWKDFKLSKFQTLKYKKYEQILTCLEVDLVYLVNLHVKHSDFPLTLIRKKQKYDELSPYNQCIQKSSDMKNLFSNIEKLVQIQEKLCNKF